MCQYCKDFKEEKFPIEISELRIEGSYYNYHCPINYCPNCGKPIYDKNIIRKEN